MLYHRDIGLPQHLVNKVVGLSMNLQYSRHAQLECIKDKRAVIRPPRTATITKENLVEIETPDDQTVTKVVIRVKYDDRNDLVMPLIPDRGFVKTCWLNDRTDAHYHLNHAAYDKPKG